MCLTQHLLANQQTHHDRQPTHSRVEDPHLLQTIRIGDIDDGLLIRRQGFEVLGIGARGGSGELLHNFVWEDGGEVGAFGGEDVGEDDAAQDDGDGGGELADEAEGAGGGSDVLWFDGALEGDEWRLEVGSHANAGDDLVDDYFGPVSGRVQVDEEAESECHEDEAEPDGFPIAACLFDVDAHKGGLEGEAEGEGEEVDARE